MNITVISVGKIKEKFVPINEKTALHIIRLNILYLNWKMLIKFMNLLCRRICLIYVADVMRV